MMAGTTRALILSLTLDGVRPARIASALMKPKSYVKVVQSQLRKMGRLPPAAKQGAPC